MTYNQINSGHEIRVLRLRSKASSRLLSSAQPDSIVPIHCDLSTVKTEESPTYDALSYVWGDDKVKQPIYLYHTPSLADSRRTQGDYTEEQVTTNLAVALENLREENDDVTLWVDALCINQTMRRRRVHS